MRKAKEAWSKVALVLTSDTTSPSSICSVLGLMATKAVVKDTPTGMEHPPVHPLNIAVFSSQPAESANVLEHLENILRLIESKKVQLKRLARETVAEIHINYATPREGGWTFETKLLRRITKLNIKLVISIGRIRSTKSATHERRNMKTRNGKTLMALLCAVFAFTQAADAFYDANLGRWINRDPLGDTAFLTLHTHGKSRSEQAHLRTEALKPLYMFVGNTPINAIDAYGLKKIKTGVKICNQGPKDNMHGFVEIDGQGYGFYPKDGSSCGVIHGPGQIDDDDPSKASCNDVELDDCAYDISKFKNCLKNKVQQQSQNPPTYSVYGNNCRQWRNSVISECAQESDKRSGGLWEQYGP